MPAHVVTSSADDGSSGTLSAENANPGTTVALLDWIAAQAIELAREAPLIPGNGTSIVCANDIGIDGPGRYGAFFLGNATSAVTATIRNLTIQDATAEAVAGETGCGSADGTVRTARPDGNLDLNERHLIVA